MRIIKLEILNLASLDRQGGEVINFEEGALKDCTIFSIVGPTGSGKSTILDAICLALYNRAPRYPLVKGRRGQKIEIYGEPEEGEKNRLAPTDGRNILTRGKKSGYSKLTFLANNGNLYRAEWHVQRDRKNFKDVATSLFILSDENGVPIEKEADWHDIPQIIGLDYEQFLSTVLIAQGSFANFLKAKEDERYELLEKLIGCEEMYSTVASRIKAKKDDAVAAFNTVNANFATFRQDIIDDVDELKALDDRIQQLEDEEKAITLERDRVKDALGWYDKEQGHLGALDAYRLAFEKAKTDLNDAREDIDRLLLHDSTLDAVNCYKDIAAADKAIDSQKTALQSLRKELEKRNAALSQEKQALQALIGKADAAAEALKQQKPHIDNARTLAGELREAEKASTLQENVKVAAGKAKEAADEAVRKNTEAIEAANKDEAAYRETLDNMRKEAEDKKNLLTDELNKAVKALDDEKGKVAGLDATSLQEAWERADGKEKALSDAIRIRRGIEKCEKTVSDNRSEAGKLTERIGQIEQEIKGLSIGSLESELDVLRKTHTLMTSEDWNQHRADLSDGSPCPLCGSTSHPYRNASVLKPVIGDMEALIRRKEDALARQKARDKQLGEERAKKQETLGHLSKGSDEALAEKSRLDGEWDSLHGKYPNWPADSSALESIKAPVHIETEEAKRALSFFNAVTQKVDKELLPAKDRATRTLNDFIRDSAEKLKETEGKWHEAQMRLTAEKGKKDNLLQQQKEKDAAFVKARNEWDKGLSLVETKREEIRKEIGDNAPDALEEALNKVHQEALDQVKQKNDHIVVIDGGIKELLGKETRTRETLAEEEKEREQKSAELSRWLDAYNQKAPSSLSYDDIVRLYQAPDDWEGIRSRKEKLDEAFTKAETTLKNEMTAYEKHMETKPDEDRDTLAARKADLDSHSDSELVGLKARKQRHDNAVLQTRGALLLQRQKADLEKKEWEEINDAIGGDGKTLRKIAQCYTLRFLIEHANAEIRKFNSRYELQQVKNSLGIRVIDHDRADDIRDITSLSGGETFIVSLGLALGLSALSSHNISFENLFIDEGFGTLDPDTLDVVIDSLAMLQSSQNKKVGVISHTTTMSEGITTQIQIVKEGNSGSSTIKIYP